MKITGLFSSNGLVKNGSPEAIVWFGRTVTPFVKNALAAVVFVTVVSVVTYLVRHFFSQKPKKLDRQPELPPGLLRLDKEQQNKLAEELKSYQFGNSQAKNELLSLCDVTAANQMMLTEDEAQIILEIFQKIEVKKCPPSAFSAYDKNKDRYPNILQLKATMVEVEENGSKIDYNGAKFTNPITGRIYILMQGPLPTTVEVTKTMMQQNRVEQIVCLTKAVESNKTKCHSYWDDWKVEQKEGLCLRIPDQSKGWTPDFMFHYEEWSDHGAPSDIHKFIKFIQTQRNYYKDGSIAVHCSAGMGRSGVFMVATLMMDLIEKGETTLNPLMLIAQLREVRPGMIQVKEQLQFCFTLANHLLTSAKN